MKAGVKEAMLTLSNLHKVIRDPAIPNPKTPGMYRKPRFLLSPFATHLNPPPDFGSL
jgi:hypothetical protein